MDSLTTPYEDESATKFMECSVCEISLKGLNLYKIHLTTTPHLKKEDAAIAAGHMVRQPRPKFTDILQYVDYLNLDEPIIGLNFLEEFPVFNAEYSSMGPRYTCTLCSVSAYPPEMIHHVIGRKHRQKYIETKRPDLVSWDTHSVVTETGKIIRTRAEIIARQDGSGRPKLLKKMKNMENLITTVPSLQRQNEDPQNASSPYQHKQELQDSHRASFAPDPLSRAPFVPTEARSMNAAGGRPTTDLWDRQPARSDDWERAPSQRKTLDLEYRLVHPVTQTRKAEFYKETQRGWDQPAEGFTTYREQEVKKEIFTKDGRCELHPLRPDYQVEHSDYQAERRDSQPQRLDAQGPRSDYQIQRLETPDYQSPRPGYQAQRPDYQSPRPDYQSPRPDYQAQRPDYQSPRPDYQSPRPDYQAQRPDYQSPRPDYQSPRPDYQAPRPDYQAQRPDYQAQRPGYQSPRPDYQAPRPDYQAQRPDYQSQSPGFQGDDQRWFSDKDGVVRLGSSMPEPPTRNARLPSDQPGKRLRDYNHGMRQDDSLSAGLTNFQTPREESRSMSALPETFQRFMNGPAGDGATGPRKRKSRFSDATAEEVANAKKMFHPGPPDAKSRAPLEVGGGMFQQENRRTMWHPDRLSQSQPQMSSQQPHGRTFREESNFRRSQDCFGNGGGRDWNGMRDDQQAYQQQGRREPSDVNTSRYEAGFGQEQYTTRRPDERAQYHQRFQGGGQQQQFQQPISQGFFRRSRSPSLEMEMPVGMHRNPQYNRRLQKLTSTILEFMSRNK
ncbi:uncharacterized protein LOC144037587 isoform X2 [Vanacampus margaritifer]